MKTLFFVALIATPAFAGELPLTANLWNTRITNQIREAMSLRRIEKSPRRRRRQNWK
jgi:hypothetical protein